MKFRYNLLFLIQLMLTIYSCNSEQTPVSDGVSTVKPTVSFTEIQSPALPGSGEPNLFVNSQGKVYFSWIDALNDTTSSLRFTTLGENKQWSEPKTIATGSDWFVNWADFPALVQYPNNENKLAAHYLQKRAAGTYDYDVKITQSDDAGKTWSNAFTPHTDGIAAEHGFVSLIPVSEDRIFAAWLDGRHTKTEQSNGHKHDDHGHGGGPMTLRTATFDSGGQLYEEAELDDKVCDCCQTGAALTENGPVVVYRDRSDTEIRDISIVRKVEGKWLPPQTVFTDGWQINGCPVNGPAIAAMGNHLAIAWFTNATEKPMVKVVFSDDGGATFTKPVRIDDGNPLGRVDIVIWKKNKVLVSWMETMGEAADIRAVLVSPHGVVSDNITIAQSGSGRSSGFPVMVKTGKDVVFAWTKTDSLTQIKTAILSLKWHY